MASWVFDFTGNVDVDFDAGAVAAVTAGAGIDFIEVDSSVGAEVGALAGGVLLNGLSAASIFSGGGALSFWLSSLLGWASSDFAGDWTGSPRD